MSLVPPRRLLGALALSLALSGPALASTPMLGEIRIFAGNFAPRGFAFCDGQLLPIPQNTALFSLLGTTYGGDGRSTFALPDLRGRVPVHVGTGAGLPQVRAGQKGPAAPVTPAPAGAAAASTTPWLGLRFIIAVQGLFPSRG